jgi:hypothetical protein
MKVLLLFPDYYFYHKTLINAFNKIGIDTVHIVFEKLVSGFKNYLINKTSGFPRSMKLNQSLFNSYTLEINKKYLDVFRKEKPDVVLVYNNQHLLPETCKEFKKNSKIVFYLGDHPLFSDTDDNNLLILEYADLIISGDSYWNEHLSILGLKNIYFDFIGFDESIFYKFKPTIEQNKKYYSELVFIGRSYFNSYGYKRTLFLNHFSTFGIKIFASGRKVWDKWLINFPDLQKRIIYYDDHNVTFNNLVYNCSKIAPVDANAGVINGVQSRIVEVLGSGILPLPEYRKDIGIVFEGIDYPKIENFNHINEITKYYLQNEDLRILLVDKMRKRLIENYNPEIFCKRIIEKLF